MTEKIKEDFLDSLIELNLHERIKKVEETKILNGAEKLEQLNYIASEIANQFTYDMSILEDTISDVLEETTLEEKEECGYWKVEDVTCDISVKLSFNY